MSARSDRGQAVTEFALVLPLFATLVIVLVLFGKALYVYLQVTHFANEGARVAAVNNPTSGTLASYLQSTYGLPNGAQVAVCYPPTVVGSARTAGNPVEVDIYTNSTWVPFGIIPQIKGAATMRLEQDTVANAGLNPTTTFNSTTHHCAT